MSAPSPTTFPPGLPARIDDASAWLGPVMAARSDWIETLTAAELNELALASERWMGASADLATLTTERFAISQNAQGHSAQRFADAPRLTAQQVEALDLFDALTNDPALHFTMELQRGDLQFVHNHTLLHDRTAFVDWPQPERRRHLLRLWLAPAQGRELPAVFALRYGTLLPGRRGGVPSADGTLRANIE